MVIMKNDAAALNPFVRLHSIKLVKHLSLPLPVPCGRGASRLVNTEWGRGSSFRFQVAGIGLKYQFKFKFVSSRSQGN